MLILVPLGVAVRGATGGPTHLVLAVLRRRLGFLNVDDAAFDDFAARYVAARSESRDRLALLAPAAFVLRYVDLYRLLPMGHALRRFEDNVVTRFLLSTDFFEHEDESRRVRYLGFHDPPHTGCRNPIARSAETVS